ncbi:hypothetical protein [Parasphingorhabdus halotolerans]|nr:hypothetical protein [Parasphingorhabdus halotolerans]
MKIENADFSGHDLAQAMFLPESLTKRFIAVLEAEGYVEISAKAQSGLGRHLELTALGTLKVEQIISESVDTSSQEMKSQDASAFFAQS